MAYRQPSAPGLPYYNVNKPIGFDEIQDIYTGNPLMTPQQVQSNLFLNAPQGSRWVEDQWNRISEGRFGSPEHFFAERQRAQAASAVATRQAEDVATAIGQHPDLAPIAMDNPGGVLRLAADRSREAMWEKAAVATRVRTASEGLRREIAQKNIPTGLPPNTLLGIGRMQHQVGGSEFPMLDEPITGTRLPVTEPTQLPIWQQENFRTLLENDPTEANKIFRQQTGQDYKQFYNEQQAAHLRDIAHANMLENEDRHLAQDMFLKQKAARNARGDWELEGWLPNNSTFGEQKRGMVAANAFQRQHLDKYEGFYFSPDEQKANFAAAREQARQDVVLQGLQKHPEIQRYVDQHAQDIFNKTGKMPTGKQRAFLARKAANDLLYSQDDPSKNPWMNLQSLGVPAWGTPQMPPPYVPPQPFMGPQPARPMSYLDPNVLGVRGQFPAELNDPDFFKK